MKIVLLGPAHPLRGGGITTFNHRLARQFLAEGHECTIVSFSLQYPSFLFPGKSQYSNDPPPSGLRILSLVNSINPINWWKVGRTLRRWQPDLIVVRFWLPLMGPALGTILRLAKRNKHSTVVCLADNIVPHEKRPGDKPFTAYFLKACDGFLTMSEKVMADLRRFETGKPALKVPHPLYDNFGAPLPMAEARQRLKLPETGRLLLFFGFVRHYKGLDLLLEALADPRVREQGIRLVVAGEFYEDERPYREQIQRLGLEDAVLVHNRFVADDEVAPYFSAADGVVQPYRNATQSGVTPLAYHFEKPMIVTDVGGLPDLVPHGRAGIVAPPSVAGLADALLAFYAGGEDRFRSGLLEEKAKLSWESLTQAIYQLALEAAAAKRVHPT